MERRFAWIYERARWPHLVWQDHVLAAKLADVRHRQGLLVGRMQALGLELRSEATLETLTSDVVASSAIEGATLDRDEVRSSIVHRLGLETGGLPPARRDVDGIVELMLDATQRYDAPLTVDRLFGWHAALFPSGRSGIHKITSGAWRLASAGPMRVVSGPMGREKVHFVAPDAARLNAEMAAFLWWFEGDQPIDPVIRAGVAHLWFVTIHPFEDGNGRIARAIADMALARADASRERYYSMSAQIQVERKAYYAALERQQREDVDVTPWLDWFLDCLGRALESSERALERVRYKSRIWEHVSNRSSLERPPVNERQRTVLERMLADFEGHMHSAKYAKLAKCSTDTALRDIRDLQERGLLVRNPAGGRSTSYRLPTLEELEAIDRRR